MSIHQLFKIIGLWTSARPSARPHIFIVGSPRSGTTLLKTILAAHSRIAGVDGESTGIFKARNIYDWFCGEVGQRAAAGMLDESNDLVSFYDRVAEAVLRYYDGEVFVDKIWPRRLRLDFVIRNYPNARWVHIVRDGRDCFCSAQSHPNIPQRKSVKTFARDWRGRNALVERCLPGDNKYRIRYEDLVRSPKPVLEGLMAFLGLELQDVQLHPATATRVTSIRKRDYHKRLDEPINPRAVRRFDAELAVADQRLFRKVAGEMLQLYGYKA